MLCFYDELVLQTLFQLFKTTCFLAFWAIRFRAWAEMYDDFNTGLVTTPFSKMQCRCGRSAATGSH